MFLGICNYYYYYYLLLTVFFVTDLKMQHLLPLAAYILLQLSTLAVADDGLNLLYTTNPRELEDVPIHFEKELPKWLKGTLVSIGKIEC